MILIGYIRTSTSKQEISPEVQRAQIADDAARRGCEIIWKEDEKSGKNLDRPRYQEALKLLREGKAQGLMVAKLDRLSRSVIDIAETMALFQKNGWILVIQDIGMDLSTPAGELVANVLAAVAQWERRTIASRTREALATKKGQTWIAGPKNARPGEPTRLGRPSTMDPLAVHEIVRLRAQGRSLRSIVTHMNEQGFKTAQGGQRWHLSIICQVLKIA
jgi:DNA invertase Pin-like site-specific DNA recombinase